MSILSLKYINDDTALSENLLTDVIIVQQAYVENHKVNGELDYKILFNKNKNKIKPEIFKEIFFH